MSKTDQVILGIKVTSHDTGAAIFCGGSVVAIAEERLNRIKHSHNMFPEKSIEYCLDALGFIPKDVDLVVLDRLGFADKKNVEEKFKEKTFGRFNHARIETINHHDAHAAAAFLCSPFDDSAVLVVDGAGERIQNHLGIVGIETETMYRGSGNTITEIQKTTHIRRHMRFPYTIGIGKLYTLFCEAYLSLGHYNEGKMMGLAPYGDDRLLQKFPLKEWYKEVGGHVVCNPKIEFEGMGRFESKKKMQKPFARFLSSIVERVAFLLMNISSKGKKEFFVPPEFFEPIRLEKPARVDEVLPDPEYAGAAYAVQKVLEEVMVSLGKRLKAITGSRNLCVAGGVGLNIDANKRFLDDVGFEHLFVQPAASDSGISLGCALYGAHQILKLPRMWQMKSASLGRIYSEKEIAGAIDARKGEINVKKSSQVAVETAKLVAGGKIIGWFHGGSEYGPRALGNRSILADARNPNMLKILNERVKHRELWRPFAASVLEEKMTEWFDINHESPFMLLASQVHKDKQTKVPSIVHVDGTCRIQSVTPVSNARYHELLQAFEKETGVPLFLNTSFNVAGEPIVETPDDAIRCFLGTNIDALILEDYIITKK